MPAERTVFLRRVVALLQRPGWKHWFTALTVIVNVQRRRREKRRRLDAFADSADESLANPRLADCGWLVRNAPVYPCTAIAWRLSVEHCRRYRHAMTNGAQTIRCKATLLRPASPKGATWTFVVLPVHASAKLPTRSLVTVEGTFGGQPFAATLQPDGQRSHWFKLTKAMREAAGLEAGDTVTIEIAPVDVEPEPRVPADLKQALAAEPAAEATWFDITAVARRDWIHWVTSGKKAETRERRVVTACDMLASGKRRACCFDRSGLYSKGLSAPTAAEPD